MIKEKDGYEFYDENLIKNKSGNILWAKNIGKEVEVMYKYTIYKFKIIEFTKERYLILEYDKKIMKPIFSGSFRKCFIGSIIGVYNGDFKIEIGETFKDDKRDLVVTNREYRERKSKTKIINEKWYKYTCNKCGWTEGWIVENALLNLEQGCSCCHSLTVVPEINSIKAKAPWMIALGVSEEDAVKYTPSSGEKIQVKCPDCEGVRDICISNIYIRKNIQCSCGDGQSYISKYIHNLLDQLSIKYDTEVKYNWNKYINPKNNKISQASIDFVIYEDNREIPLEADGKFHRSDNKMNGQTKEHSEYIDKQRDENCLKYLSEETIRISDEGDIKENILNSKLNELFDLSEIDWNKCEEFALKNIVKEVCEYWNQKEDWETTSDLARVFNLDKTSIIKYLKKGTKLGWCLYDGKEEMSKCASRIAGNNKKGVSVYKNEMLLGMFSSCSELERKSEELFGIKMISSEISSRLNPNDKKGKYMKPYKGFTLKNN